MNEDVDSEMFGNAHFDSIYSSPHAVLYLATPTANGIKYGLPVGSSTSSFDSNSNPINSYNSE